MIQAAGAALLLPTSLALLLPEFEPSRALARDRHLGGGRRSRRRCGPPVGGLLVELSWRLVFLVNVPIGLAAIVYGTGLLNESRDPRQERPTCWARA